MYLNFEFIVIAALATVFAGISKGGFGSGAAFASAAILATIIEPGTAIGIMLPLLILMDLGSLKPYWKKWRSRESWILIIGSIPGVILGAMLYSSVSADFFRFLIGIICLAFVLWQALQKWSIIRKSIRPLSDFYGTFLGCFAGFTSFISHAGGPPAAIYLLSKNPTKTEYQATTVIVFWAVNLAKAVPYTFLGLFTLETLFLDLILAPFSLIGVWIGVKAHYVISERLFFFFTYILLTLTGARLIWVALF
jgi:hypothetical protein